MNNTIEYQTEDANCKLIIKAEFTKVPSSHNNLVIENLRKFINTLKAEYQTIPPVVSNNLSLTFDDVAVKDVLSNRQIFPKTWTCYQPIDSWPLHSKDAEMRKYLQYIPDIKLLQEFAPVFNVIPDNVVIKESPIVCGKSASGLPDEVYALEYNANEFTGVRPIPDNLCVKIDEAYFDIPSAGPWVYKGVPSLDILKKYQEGTIGTNLDRHAIIVDKNYLWEFYKIFRYQDKWYCGYAVRWDLSKLPESQRDPKVNVVYGHNSCDAAGMPIFPLLIRKDELDSGVINHAIRCTIQPNMIKREWALPAVHQAGGTDNILAPRYGERFRLRKDVDISKMSAQGQVIATALKKYGMIVADGGTSVRLSCCPNVPVLHSDFWQLNFNHFEIVVPPK